MKNQKSISRFILVLFSIFLLTSCGKGCQKGGSLKGASDPLNFIPANNNLLVSVNWKKLIAAPFYNDLSQKIPPEAKELTSHLDSMLIAVNVHGGAEPPAGLMIFTGSLEEKKVLPILEADAKKEGKEIKKETFENQTIYLSPKDPNIGLAFISNSQLLAGQLSSLKEALTLISKGGDSIRSNKDLVDLFTHRDTNKLIWGAATIPPSVGQNPGQNPMSNTLQGLKAFSLTVDYDKDLAIELTGNAQDNAQAQNLANLMNSYKTIFGASLSSKDPALGQAIQGMQINNQDASLKVSLKLPRQVVEKMSKDLKEKKDSQENQIDPSNPVQ